MGTGPMFTRLLARLGEPWEALRNFDNRPVRNRSFGFEENISRTGNDFDPSTVPPGRDSLGRYPGTSCLATISLSLREKSHSLIEGPRMAKLAPTWAKTWALRALQAKPSRPLNLPNSPFLRIIRDRSNVIHSLARLERVFDS